MPMGCGRGVQVRPKGTAASLRLSAVGAGGCRRHREHCQLRASASSTRSSASRAGGGSSWCRERSPCSSRRGGVPLGPRLPRRRGRDVEVLNRGGHYLPLPGPEAIRLQRPLPPAERRVHDAVLLYPYHPRGPGLRSGAVHPAVRAALLPRRYPRHRHLPRGPTGSLPVGPPSPSTCSASWRAWPCSASRAPTSPTGPG